MTSVAVAKREPPPKLSMEMRGIVIQQYLGTRCRCGTPKREKESFCSPCWHRLPKKLRSPLFNNFTDEYARAYLACCDFLDAGAPPKEA